MFKTTIISALVLASFLMINCNTSKKSIDIETAKEKATISITKSSCFGKCEVYSLFVNKKNLVFNGIKNIEPIGLFGIDFDKSSYDKLTNLFSSNNFIELEESYLSTLKDLQTISITYEGKSVKFHERNAPDGLKNVLKELESLVKSKDWK